MGGVEALETYKEAGVAGLFIVMYVTTVWFLIRMLMKDKQSILKQIDAERVRTQEMTKIVEENAGALRQTAEIIKELKDTIQRDTDAHRELITYWKARDQFLRGKRS